MLCDDNEFLYTVLGRDRKECQCNPVRYFAIMSMQRSGSGWFETLLNSHPNISSNGEIFSIKERRANISAIFRTMDIVFNLDWISSSAKNECLAAVGFKWMLNQVSSWLRVLCTSPICRDKFIFNYLLMFLLSSIVWYLVICF